MSNYIKGAFKVFTGYAISLLLFVVFLYTVISLAGDNTGYWLAPYSFLFFILTTIFNYTEMKTLAEKEKRPAFNAPHYPLKGLILGFIGFLPFIILELIYPFLNFNDEVFNRLARLSLHTMLGPVFVFVKLFGMSVWGYLTASIMVPLGAMLGYLAGYYGYNIPLFKNKRKPSAAKPGQRTARK